MQPLNAIDAIAPAFTRTHQTLFQPFRLGRSWKLAASQYLGFGGAMFVPTPLLYFLLPHSITDVPAARAILLGGVIFFTAFSLLALYLLGRMELVAFEMLVARAKFIAPMWRHYSARVWPWIGLKLIVGTLWTILLAAIFFSPIRHMFQALSGAFTSVPGNIGPNSDPMQMQEIIAPVMAQMIDLQFTMYALLFLLKIPSTLLGDFVLPFFVLEDITLAAALSRGLAVFIADSVGVLLYLILKPILFIIAIIMNQVATTVVLVPFGIVVGIVVTIGGIAGAASHHAGTGLALGFGFIFMIVLFAIVVLYLSFFTVGYLLTLFEAYGIYFLGGRYPLLGDLLEPGPGKPFTPPPVFPSDEELRDNDGGPPMPMDPAVA